MLHNQSEANFAVHNIAAHCLSGWDGEIVTTGDLLDDALGDPGGTELEVSDLHIIRGSDRAKTFFGDRTGGIFEIAGTDDNGSAIEVDIRTARLNPYTNASYGIAACP